MFYHVRQNGTYHGTFLSYEALKRREFTVELQFNLLCFTDGSRSTDLLPSNQISHLLTVSVEKRRRLVSNTNRNLFHHLRRT